MSVDSTAIARILMLALDDLCFGSARVLHVWFAESWSAGPKSKGGRRIDRLTDPSNRHVIGSKHDLINFRASMRNTEVVGVLACDT